MTTTLCFPCSLDAESAPPFADSPPSTQATERMEPPTVLLCDEDAGAAAPRYDVIAASALAAAGTLAAERSTASGGGAGKKSGAVPLESASRGSTVTVDKTHASFLIAAVAENRAREIGTCYTTTLNV